tara:strand:- start:69 stop:359 length:291 start_codon:yes stop_codon:yes gene_type:complete
MTIDNLISWLQEAEDNNTWLVSTQSVKRHLEKIKETEQLTLTDVVERFALIQWINGQPLIDGSDSFNTKEDALKHWQTLPKIDNVIYTVCRIRNVL